MTSIPGVFAGGDIVTGGGDCRHGRRKKAARRLTVIYGRNKDHLLVGGDFDG